MNQKKVKALRKKLGLKLPIKADYRVSHKVKKIAYLRNPMGVLVATPVERVTIVNASKYQYRKIKKIFKGMR